MKYLLYRGTLVLWAFATGGSSDPPRAPRLAQHWRLPSGAALLLAVTLAVLAVVHFREHPPKAAASRFLVLPPDKATQVEYFRLLRPLRPCTRASTASPPTAGVSWINSEQQEAAASPITVALNWAAGLKK